MYAATRPNRTIEGRTIVLVNTGGFGFEELFELFVKDLVDWAKIELPYEDKIATLRETSVVQISANQFVSQIELVVSFGEKCPMVCMKTGNRIVVQYSDNDLRKQVNFEWNTFNRELLYFRVFTCQICRRSLHITRVDTEPNCPIPACVMQLHLRVKQPRLEHSTKNESCGRRDYFLARGIDRCLKVINIKTGITWNNAYSLSQNEGSNLLSIKSKDESYILRQIFELNSVDLLVPRYPVLLSFRTKRGKNARWTDGDPVTYTEWAYPGSAGLSPVIQTSSTEDPGEMFWVDNHVTRPERLDINTISSQALLHDHFHSLTDSTYTVERCGALISFIHGHYSQWFTAPCSQTIQPVSVICQTRPAHNNSHTDANTRNQSVSNNTQTLKNEFCMDGLLMDDRCITLTRAKVAAASQSIKLSFDRWPLIHQVASLDTPIQSLLLAWFEHIEHKCNVLDYSFAFSVTTNITQCEPIYVTMYNFSADDSCPGRLSKCANGVCILDSYVCDGNIDCSDGSDELGCDSGVTIYPVVQQNCSNNNPCPAWCFACLGGGGHCLSANALCDGIVHCTDGSDELYCSENNCIGEINLLRGTNQLNVLNSTEVSLVQDEDCYKPTSEKGLQSIVGKRNCHGSNTTSLCLKGNISTDDLHDRFGGRANNFRCVEKEIESNLVNDMVIDCVNGEDEPLMHGAGFRIMLPHDTDATMAPCYPGHPVQFSLQQICVYNIDSSGILRPCPNGQHLQNCEFHQCRGFFKCPLSYCLPLQHVCDGQADCPGGEDENQDCHISNHKRCIKRSLWCPVERICVPTAQICDGIKQCNISGDDEKACQAHACPEACVCSGHSISCTDVDRSQVIDHKAFDDMLLVLFQHAEMTPTSGEIVAKTQTRTKILILQGCQLKIIDEIGFKGLIKLDLSFNQIALLHSNMFKQLSNLLYLSLQHNPIQTVESNAFQGVPKLAVLDLSSTSIKQVGVDSFVGLSSVKRLEIRNSKIQYIAPLAFLPFKTIQEVVGIQKKICCLNRNIPCTPSEDCTFGWLSQGSLFFMLSLGILCCISNLHQLTSDQLGRDRKVRYTTVKFLKDNLNLATSISNILYGLHIVMMTVAHILYKNSYQYMDEWMHSKGCKISQSLALVSSNLSLFFHAISRMHLYMLVTNPTKWTETTIPAMFIGALLLCLLSIAPSVAEFQTGIYLKHDGFCTLISFMDLPRLRRIFAVCFVTYNTFMLCFMVICHVCMSHTIARTKNMSKRRYSTKVEVELQMKAFVLIGTTFLSYVPMTVLVLLMLWGDYWWLPREFLLLLRFVSAMSCTLERVLVPRVQRIVTSIRQGRTNSNTTNSL